MKLLQEEFFGKVWKVISEIKIIPIRWISKAVFFMIIVFLLILIAWSVYAEKYTLLIVLGVIIVVGEVAHFIRKSREQAMNKVIETKNDLKDEEENPLNEKGLVLDKETKINRKKVKKVFKEKVLNKEGLLSKK